VVEILGDAEWVGARKRLLDPEFLKPPRNVIGRARKYLETLTLPFPVKSLALVSNELIEKVDSRLQGFKDEFWEEFENIERGYAEAYATAREYLEPRGLFNAADYPLDLRAKYRFEWRFVVLDTPGRTTLISKELYLREKQKFREMMDEARQLAITALYEEFSELTRHMTERLAVGEDGKPRTFKDSLVKNFEAFFETFDARNLFGDERLKEMVDRTRTVLSGITPEQLREFPDFRARIRKDMEEVKNMVDDATINTPRRKLKLDLAA
jgi:hypothetical protein